MPRTQMTVTVWRWVTSILTAYAFIAFLIAMMAVMSAPANAQLSACPTYERIVALLRGKYREELQAFGVDPFNNQAVQLWVAPGGRTFSVVIRRRDGTACFISSGTDWHVVPVTEGEPT